MHLVKKHNSWSNYFTIGHDGLKYLSLRECLKFLDVMHLSMLSPKVQGRGATRGNLIQRAFPRVGILTLSPAPGSGI